MTRPISRLAPILLFLCAFIGLHCDFSDLAVGNGAGDSCLEDEDCHDGYECRGGICVAEIVPADSDMDAEESGEEPDYSSTEEEESPGDWDDDFDCTGDGEIAMPCYDQGGTCSYSGECPEGTEAMDDPMGCGSNALCCMLWRPCATRGGYCEPPVASACYRNGYLPHFENAWECGNIDGFCCLPETDCLMEGESGTIGEDHCCSGLTEVEGLYPLATDSVDDCKPGCENCFYCTRCGNDICGEAENYCNCPHDCPEPSTPCYSVQDCPTSECFINTTGECVQTDSSCESEICRQNMQAFEDHLCLDRQCTPRICTPGDTVTHTCWNGDEVTACECLAGGGWRCEENVESLCPDEPECSPGQRTYYPCLDGSEVVHCQCQGDAYSPRCRTSGTAGWVDGFTGEMLLETACESCFAVCRHEGSYSEGWYDSCNGQLIQWGDCSPEWECVANPKILCPIPDLSCEEARGTCVQGDCAVGEYRDERFSCESGSCCLPTVYGDCRRAGGNCDYMGMGCLGAFYKAPYVRGCPEGIECCMCPFDDCSSPPECAEHEDCPEAWCVQLSDEDGNRCMEIDFECQYNSCVPRTTTLDNYVCDPQTNRCREEEIPCLTQGGHCYDSYTGCQLGYVAVANPMGCERPYPTCCLPVECTEDEDCPDPGCSMEGDTCISYDFGCLGSECRYNRRSYPGHECSEEGYCVAPPIPDCEEEGGTCIGWGPECPETHYNSTNACGYGQCCMPHELGDCHQFGGTCTNPLEECPEGSFTYDWAESCSYYRSRCCLPGESTCPEDLSQCSTPRCEDLSIGGAPYCREFRPDCRYGRCAESETYYPDRRCHDADCLEGPDFCRAKGGFCVWGDDCPGIDPPLAGDAVCGEGAVCCTDYTYLYTMRRNCYAISPLPDPFCYDAIDEMCVDFTPWCVADLPPNQILIMPFREHDRWECIEGECVAPNSCIEIGGICQDAYETCPADWIEAEEADCGDESQGCCVPFPASECERMGGVCGYSDESYTLVNYNGDYACDFEGQVCTEIESFTRCWGHGGYQIHPHVAVSPGEEWFPEATTYCPEYFHLDCPSRMDCCCLPLLDICEDNEDCLMTHGTSCRMDESTGDCIENRTHCLQGHCRDEEKALPGRQCVDNYKCD